MRAHSLHDQALSAEQHNNLAEALRLHDEAKRAFLEAAETVGPEDPETSKSFILLAEFHRAKRRAIKKSMELAASQPRSSPLKTASLSLATQPPHPPLSLTSVSKTLLQMGEELHRFSLNLDSRSESPQRVPTRPGSPPARFGEDSYYFVPGDEVAASMMRAGPEMRRQVSTVPVDSRGLVQKLQLENDKLTRERDEARRQLQEERARLVAQKHRFFAMFAALKAELERQQRT